MAEQMTPDEHEAEAMRLVTRSIAVPDTYKEDAQMKRLPLEVSGQMMLGTIANLLAEAQVHATLATRPRNHD